MAYNNNQQQGDKKGYDRNLDKQIAKFSSKSEKRFLNVIVYEYNGGATKIRISPVESNSNPNAEANKKFINKPGISGLTAQEARDLAANLIKAADAL